MNILLGTPLYSAGHWDAGHFWLRALNQLGHAVVVWDYRLEARPPKGHFDFSVMLKGGEINPQVLPRPRVCYWPDALERTPGIEHLFAQYDKVYTCLRPTPPGMEWLPTGWDPDIHTDLKQDRWRDSIFIGTWTKRKEGFLRLMEPQFIMGNGWQSVGLPNEYAIYMHDYVAALNETKVLINVHHGEVGLNRRLFEMIACGFTITDRVPGIDEVLGNLADAVSFRTPEAGAELKRKWLTESSAIREAMWKEEREMIAPFTYLEAAKRVISLV